MIPMVKKPNKRTKVQRYKKKKRPDINVSYIKHRTTALLSWKNGKVGPCYDSIVSLNNLLPPDYRVEFKQIDLSSKNSFSAWVWGALTSIDEKMADFRNDHWSKKE